MRVKKRKKKVFDRSRFRKGLKESYKQSLQKSQGFAPTHLNLPEDIKIYNPKPGEHSIDIIPYIVGSNDPEKKEGKESHTCSYLVHKDVGPQRKWYICPEQFGKDCPICEERRVMIEEGEDKEVFKKLYPRPRNLYNVVSYDSREEERKGVQLLDVAEFFMEDPIFKLANKTTKKRSSKSKLKKVEPFVEFANPDEGKVITFVIEAAKSSDGYTQWSGHAFEDRDYVIDDELLQSAYTLDEFLKVPDYDELKSVFKRSDDEDEEEDSEEEDSEEEDGEDDIDEDELELELEDNEEDKEYECEYGFDFGVDANDYDECEDECDEDCWQACVAAKEASQKKKKKKVRRRRR